MTWLHHPFPLAACGLLTACSAWQPAGEETTPVPVAPTAEAEIFAPGTISDHRWQYRLTFTPDGRTAYFTVADAFFPASREATIYVSQQQEDGTWGTPEVAPFSGRHTDIDPFLTPDGQRLYFSSIRPLNGEPRPGLDLFYVERTPQGWGDPVRLGPEVNTEQDELYASADAAGNLYFASGPARPSPDANWNIYSARPRGSGFAPREPVAAVNTRRPWNPDDPTWDWEFNPEVSVDGRTLIFTSLRPGGFGFGDLYVSHHRDGEWSEPVNLGPAVNTEHDEFHPTLSRDGQTLYFARTILSPDIVPSSFYRIPTSSVAIFPGGGDGGPGRLASDGDTPSEITSEAEAEIRARRERFNDAIVARDTTALARIWTADVRVVTSAGGRIEGRDAYRERFAGYFADREEYSYRREPSRIEVHEPWGIAAEHGRWRARWRDADGLIDVGGDYLIQWTRVEGRWFVHAEMFAPVHCSSDGRYCRERP